MIYHLNRPIAIDRLNSIQQSAMLRLEVLREHNIDSKILTVMYDPHQNYCGYHNLDVRVFESMYDYFQQAKDITTAPAKVQDFFPDNEYTIEKAQTLNDLRVFRDKKYIAYIGSNDGQSISRIVYADGKNRFVKTEVYDVRGFLSCERILTDKQVLVAEMFYTVSGEKVIEKYYKYENNKNLLTLIRVKHHGEWICLSKEVELITLFLESFLTDGDIVIDDHMNEFGGEPLINLNNKNVKSVTMFHGAHAKQGDFSDKRNVLSKCYTALSHIEEEKVGAIVVQTEEQKKDLAAMFGNEEKIYVIPTGFRSDVEQIPSTNAPKLIYIGYFHNDTKRAEDAMRAFSYIVKEVPQAELHMFGFNILENDYSRKLAEDLNIKDSVKFRGYVADLSEEYATSKIIILTSKTEAFCLALLEAASYGIPAVSYGVKYGPADLIRDGHTGYLTSESPEELAGRVVSLLTNPEKYAEFSKNAYEHSFNFSKSEFAQKWLRVLNG